MQESSGAVCAIAKICAGFGLKFVFTFAAAMHFDKLLQELHYVSLIEVAVTNVGHFYGHWKSCAVATSINLR